MRRFLSMTADCSVDQLAIANNTGSGGGQKSALGDCTGQQRHASDDNQFPVLTGGKRKAEHSPEVLHADQFGGENVWYANWIDELDFHTANPLRLIPVGGWCAGVRNASIAGKCGIWSDHANVIGNSQISEIGADSLSAFVAAHISPSSSSHGFQGVYS